MTAMASSERSDQISVQLVRAFAIFVAIIVLGFHWLPGGAPGLLPQRAVIALLLIAIASATVLSERVRRNAALLLHAFAYGFSVWFITVVASESFSPERAMMLIIAIAGQGLLFFSARGLLTFYIVQVTLVALAVGITPDPGVDPSVLIGGLAILSAASGAVAVSRSRTLQHLQELSSVARQVSAGLALIESSGEIRWSNRRLGDLLGEPESLTGRSLPALLGSEDSELARAIEERQQAEGDRRRGRQWLSVRLIPLRSQGERERTIAVIDDVTARRAALERIVSVVSEALLVVDSAGRVRSANNAAEALLGASSADMVGEPLVTFLAADGSEDAGHRLLFEVGGPDSEPRTRALRFSDARGAAIPTTTVAAALPVGEGEPPTILLIIRDARPEREQARQQAALEERLQRAQRLESLETLAGRVAHDANNLLVSVMGHAGLAAMRADEETALRLERLQAAAEQAAQLNAQLLSLAGRDGFSAQAIDLSAFVAGAEPLLRATVAPQATLQLSLSETLPPITGDPGRLQQALLGLARNASEALEGNDGTITISTSAEAPTGPIPIAVDPPLQAGTYAVLSVRDTGVGIDDAVVEQMFAPDFSTRAPERGLGLAATLGIVRAHGGGVVVERPGRGALVRIYLPAAPSPEAPEPPVPVSRAAGPGAVLLVDDDEDVREIAREALERAGYRVLSAQNGVQCLRTFAAERSRIRVVLLDLNMPGMRGEEILRRLHTAAPEVPVVITSGYAPHHIDGAAKVIHKPYRLRDLIAAVQQLTPSQD